MKWNDIQKQPCSVARALSDVGERWTLLVVRDAMLGARTFGEFAEGTGMARNILSARLEQLVEAGILRKRESERSAGRHEYVLTPKGLDLHPVVMALVRWGDRWHDDGLGKPVEHTHRDCGQVFHVEPTCSECGEVVNPEDVRVVVGPSYRDGAKLPDAWRFVERD